MADLAKVVDLEIPIIRKWFSSRHQTELLIDLLGRYGFSTGDVHNLYHGLSSKGVLYDILDARAVMGPRLVDDYFKQKSEGKQYGLPERKGPFAGNPSDNGEFAGFADLDHATHIAVGGEDLGSAFNEHEPIVLGFKCMYIFPLVQFNYLKLEDPQDGLGIIIAPQRIKEEIEARIAEGYPHPDFFRIYVSFASRR